MLGDCPLDLIFVHGWISHIEHVWEEPSLARFLRHLASFSRLILLEKRGTGLSDPAPLDRLPTLEERMDDVRAVMDATGSSRATLMGTSGAGALNLLARRRRPEAPFLDATVASDPSEPENPTPDDLEADCRRRSYSAAG